MKNGVVVFEGQPPLEDGIEVRIEPVRPVEGLPSQLPRLPFRPVGAWDGPPGELDRLLAQVQELRERDLSSKSARANDPVSP
jgi:hypothetical protein